MKHLLLAAGLLLAGCSSPTTEKPVVARLQVNDSLDTNTHVIIDPTWHTDTTLIYPVVTYPSNLCGALQHAWSRYMHAHQEVKQQFPFKDGIVACSAGLEVVIDSKGDVEQVINDDKAPAILAKHCVAALLPVFKKSKWQPLYHKSANRRDALVTRAALFVILNPDYSLALYL